MSTAKVPAAQAQPEFRSILFATNFSASTREALEWLKVVARQLGSSIVLTHFMQIEGRRRAEGQPVQIENADGRLNSIRDELHRTAGLSASIAAFQLKHEMPFAAQAFEAQLREIIKAKSIDLIMLGTSAPQGLRRLARGSFAEGIFRHTDVPVLVVGPGAATITPPQLLNKVLFATDFELESVEALPVAAAFARQLRASLVLLTVKRGSRRFPDFVAWLPELLTAPEDPVKESVDRLRRLADQFGIPDSTIVVLSGSPAIQISRYIKQESISTLVLGIRAAEYEDAVAMHIPTLVGKLVSSVTCPVLTFRGKRQSRGYQVRPITGF